MFIEYIKKIFSFFGLIVLSKKGYENFVNYASLAKKLEIDMDFLKTIPAEMLLPVFENLKFSKSQLRQDIFVLMHLQFKENGFFIEFGATDGFHDSNTFLLEKKFKWQGILVEPGRLWHNNLNKNRNVKIDTRCVYSFSNTDVDFHEVHYS